MNQDTLAIIAGKNSEENSGTVNVPIHRTSTVLFPTLKAYDDAEHGKAFYKAHKNLKATDFSYGIGGTPTNFALEDAITQLEGGDKTFIYPSGLSAITMTLLTFLSSGDHVLITDSIYGPTRRFCNKELKRFGIETTYYDPMIGSKIRGLIQDNTKLIFTESPGSLTFEVQDIPAIVKVAKEKNIVTVTDNSWATSLYFKPLKHGVDVSLHAGTKYIGGHSDIILGTITTTKEHISKFSRNYIDYGVHASPDDCYLALRGLKTMPTRIKAHEEKALNIAKWLKKKPKVAKILHPAFSSCPGHKVFKRDFLGSTGLFTIILDKKYSFKELSHMIDPMKIFGIGASWGGYESLILPFDPASIRTATKWTEKGSCVRLYIGLEDEDDLKKELQDGLKRLG